MGLQICKNVSNLNESLGPKLKKNNLDLCQEETRIYIGWYFFRINTQENKTQRVKKKRLI